MFAYINTDTKKVDPTIEALFEQWDHGKECICVFSPHDDDALIGASYAMKAAMQEGAKVYVYIFCDGNAGYSDANQKHRIVKIREKETERAYGVLGISPSHIIRFHYMDFTAIRHFGWKLEDGRDGSFKSIVTALRKHEVTRVLVPNHYREHIDHTAVHMMGAYDAIQAGDPIVADWGEPTSIKSVMEYSVWSDFSPQDALLHNRSVRANRLVIAPYTLEQKVAEAIACYQSQGQIIQGLIESRKERYFDDEHVFEPYIVFDPRPKLDFSTYSRWMEQQGFEFT